MNTFNEIKLRDNDFSAKVMGLVLFQDLALFVYFYLSSLLWFSSESSVILANFQTVLHLRENVSSSYSREKRKHP